MTVGNISRAASCRKTQCQFIVPREDEEEKFVAIMNFLLTGSWVGWVWVLRNF
jgi:hypothetical protein